LLEPVEYTSVVAVLKTIDFKVASSGVFAEEDIAPFAEAFFRPSVKTKMKQQRSNVFTILQFKLIGMSLNSLQK
jgi:hypothetical protein